MANNKYSDDWHDKRQQSVQDQLQAVKDYRASQNDTLPNDDDMRDLTDISPDEEAAMERAAVAKQEAGATDDKVGKGYNPDKTASKSDDPDSLKDAEKSGNDTPDDKVGAGYTGDSKGKRKGFWNKKRTSIAGAVSGAGLLGILGIGGIASGPMQLIHLSETLGKNFTSQTDAGNSRISHLFRYIRTGNVGETRLGFVESKVNKRIVAKLKANGIKINPTGVNGQVGTVELDLTKNPTYAEEYNKATAAKDTKARNKVMRQALVDNGMDPSTDLKKIKNSVLTMDLDGKSVKAKRGAIKISVKSQKLGKIRTALRVRILAKYYNAPSMFHPLEKLAASSDGKIATSIKKRQEKRAKKILERSAKAKAATESIKSKVGVAGKISGSFLAVTGSVCTVRQIAKGVAVINYGNVVVPATRIGMEGIAIGSQVKAGGEDVDPNLLGSVADGFYDKKSKSTIWDASALKYEQGYEGGTDMPDKIKPSFSSENTAANIVNFIDNKLGGEELCSTIGLIVQTAAGVALLVATVGTSGVVAPIVNSLATAGAIAALQHYLPTLLSNEPIPAELTGALGGNVAAYGARSAANQTYMASGGTALTNGQEASLRQQQNAENLAKFQSKSFAQRMFDASDSRSLLGSIVNTQKSNPIQNIKSMAMNAFGSGGYSLQTAAAAVSSNAYAAGDAPAYDYGFPKYGFSQDELDNPAVADPYANADKVVGLADSYKDDVKACFGVDLVEGDHGLEANAVEDVNPTSDEYTDADCSRPGDLEWLRVRMFIFDSGAMDSYACYNGESDSCAKLGINASAPLGDDDSSSSATTSNADFPLKTSKAEMTKQNSGCFDSKTKKMCQGGHPYAAYDIMASTDTPVLSLFDGKVTSVSTDKCPGRFVSVYSKDKGVVVSYMHMSVSKTMVKNGDTVSAGQQIGWVGTTAEGCVVSHLHIDVSAGDRRPGCKREDCPIANQKIFTAGNDKIGLGKLLYQGYEKLN